jgi:hypothetical protein
VAEAGKIVCFRKQRYREEIRIKASDAKISYLAGCLQELQYPLNLSSSRSLERLVDS